MGYNFWGSSNGKYCIVEKEGRISLKRDESSVWENSLDGIDMTGAEVADSGAVLIHGSGLCYYIPAGTSKIVPMNNLPYNNLLMIHGHFIKMSEDGAKIAYVRSETKKGISLFGFGKASGNGLQVEYELIIETLETGKQKSIYKITVPNSLSEYLAWDISGDFFHAMITVPKQSGQNIDLSVYNFDLKNVADKMKKMSLKNIKITDSRLHNTGNLAIRVMQNRSESIIIMNKNSELFNMDVSASETLSYLARGFVVFREQSSSGSSVLSVRKIEGDSIAKYEMNVFTDNNIDFDILFKENEKDFLNIVYVLNDKFYSYPSDILTLPTELKRVEIALMSGSSSRVSSSEGMTYFSDYFDAPPTESEEVSAYIGDDDSESSKQPSLYGAFSDSKIKRQEDSSQFAFDFGQYSGQGSDFNQDYSQNANSVLGFGVSELDSASSGRLNQDRVPETPATGGFSLDFSGSSAIKSRKVQKNVPSSLSLPSSGKAFGQQASQPLSLPSSGRLDAQQISLPASGSLTGQRTQVPQQLSLPSSGNLGIRQPQYQQDAQQYQQPQYQQPQYQQDAQQYQQPQYRGTDPEIKKLEKMIESLEDRYLLGEISEDSYNDLKSKYVRQLKAKKAGL